RLGAGVTVAELLGAGEVEIAPGRGFGLVAELLEGVGLQQAGRPVVRIGVDDVADDLGDPAVVTFLEARPGFGEYGVGTAHVVDVAAGGLGGRMGVEVGGVAVEPAEVALVDGLGVVADGSVELPEAGFGLQGVGQVQVFGDLAGGEAVV